MEHTRVLIADDHPLYRDGIRSMLGATPDIEVAGEAASGDEAVSLSGSLHPDVVLMDVQMPGINGIEATRRIVGASPETRVLVVTMFENDASVFAAMRAGARGYVLKDARRDEMLRAIRAVSNGEAIFSPAIAARLIDFFNTGHPTAPPDAFPELTDREREILTMIGQGMSNGEIATKLVLSSSTVRNYVSNIFSKLEVADRAQAIIKAREAGMA